jgi:hypothetical protein
VWNGNRIELGEFTTGLYDATVGFALRPGFDWPARTGADARAVQDEGRHRSGSRSEDRRALSGLRNLIARRCHCARALVALQTTAFCCEPRVAYVLTWRSDAHPNDSALIGFVSIVVASDSPPRSPQPCARQKLVTRQRRPDNAVGPFAPDRHAKRTALIVCLTAFAALVLWLVRRDEALTNMPAIGTLPSARTGFDKELPDVVPSAQGAREPPMRRGCEGTGARQSVLPRDRPRRRRSRTPIAGADLRASPQTRSHLVDMSMLDEDILTTH